jgi:hypothetical protein
MNSLGKALGNLVISTELRFTAIGRVLEFLNRSENKLDALSLSRPNEPQREPHTKYGADLAEPMRHIRPTDAL